MADAWLDIGSAQLDSNCGDNGSNYDLADALDGLSYGWGHSDNEDHWFILDLGSTHSIKKVRGRSNTTEDPTDVDIFVSDSKTVWGAAVFSGDPGWQDHTTWVETDTTDKNGRYVKVLITNTEDDVRRINWRAYSGSDQELFDVYGEAAGGTEHTHFPTDTMTISDSLAVAATYNVAAADTHAIDDSLATPVAQFNVALDDTLSINDVLTSAVMQFNVALNDTLAISDSSEALKILHHSASDTLSISDALEAAMTFNISLDDTLNLSDAVTSAVMTFRVVLADTLGISDSLAVAASYAVALTDTMNISDSLAAAAVYNVALADTLEMSDSVLAGWVLYVSLSDTMEMSDSLTVELIEGIIRKIRRGHIQGLKPARVVKVGRIGV